MPKTLPERMVFGILMSSIMVYGMEVYNAAILHSGMSNSLFAIPIGEFLLLNVIVILLQELLGGRLAKRLAFRLVNPSSGKPFTITIVIQIMTVCIMCPLMSMVATLLFKGIDIQIPAKWVQTVIINFPMALFWQILVAGPLVRLIFRKLFLKQTYADISTVYNFSSDAAINEGSFCKITK